jgi:hypothetical protein
MIDQHTHRWLSSDESPSLSAYKMTGPYQSLNTSLANNAGSDRLIKAIDVDARREAFQLAGSLLTSQVIFLTSQKAVGTSKLRKAILAAT